MPPLAPTGAVISLFANGTPALNGRRRDRHGDRAGSRRRRRHGGDGVPGGSPVHNGTLVTFTSTIGTITPNEVDAQRPGNGQAAGDGRSGVASIAYSGSAKSAELKINVYAAAGITSSHADPPFPRRAD
jgi:hypothetical protein